MSTKKFGKYRSRRKRSTKKTKGACLIGDIGDAVSGIGDFVQKSGKAVADVAEQVAPVLGKGVEYIGSQIHDDVGIGKAIKDVGSFTAKHSKAAANTLGKASPYIGKGMSYIGGKMREADPGDWADRWKSAVRCLIPSGSNMATTPPRSTGTCTMVTTSRFAMLRNT